MLIIDFIALKYMDRDQTSIRLNDEINGFQKDPEPGQPVKDSSLVVHEKQTASAATLEVGPSGLKESLKADNTCQKEVIAVGSEGSLTDSE